MSLKSMTFALGIIAAATGSVQAAQCTLSQTRIDLVTSPIMITGKQGAGALLLSRTWPLNITGDISDCTQPQKLLANISSSALRSVGNSIWQSSVPGVGLRFTLETASGQKLSFLDDINLPPSQLKGARVKMEVLKTNDFIGSGTLAAGEYARLTLAGQAEPVVQITMPPQGIKVIAPSCEIADHGDRRVTLPPVMIRAFKGPGSWVGETPFDINLICHGGLGPRGEGELKINWFGQQAKRTNPNDGVLYNTLHGGMAARGVGIQVLDWNKNPIRLNSSQTIEALPRERKVIPLKMRARYYQYDQMISAGHVQGALTFTLGYH